VDRPTTAEVRAISDLLADVEDVKLGLMLDEGAALASVLTGRMIGPVDGGEPLGGCSWEDVPAFLRPVALRAVAAMAELAVTQWSLSSRSSAGGRLLKSISAGPWSESYFGPEEVSGAKVLSPDPATNALLMALLTPCMLAFWRLQWGEEEAQVGFGMAQEFDYWRGRSGGY
jgi:hypothetical protein